MKISQLRSAGRGELPTTADFRLQGSGPYRTMVAGESSPARREPCALADPTRDVVMLTLPTAAVIPTPIRA